MAQHDHPCREPDQLRCRHIILVLLHHDGAAHGACILHPEAQAYRKHQYRERAHGVEAIAEHRFGDAVDQQRDQNGGKRKLHVGDAHDQAVDGAADITGDQPQDDTERAREQHAKHANRQRYPQTIENGGEHVAALFVGAEQERALPVGRPERRDPRIHQLKLCRIERVLHGKNRCENGEQKEQCGDRSRDHGQPGAPERKKHVALENAREPAPRHASLARYALFGWVRDNDFGHGLSRLQAGRLMVERRRGSTMV